MTNINKKDVITTILVAGLIYMLNQRTAMYQCAAIFTAILFIVNTRLINNTSLSAFKMLGTGAALSLPLYAIIGTAFSSQMTIMSFISLLVSGFSSIYITSVLKNKYSFPISLLISLVTVAMIDGLIMKSYFTAYDVFSIDIIGMVFNKELLFKTCYASVISAIMYVAGLYTNKKDVSN